MILNVTALIPRGASDEPPDLAALAAFRARLLARVEDRAVRAPAPDRHALAVRRDRPGRARQGRGGSDPPAAARRRCRRGGRATLEGGGGLAGVPYATGVRHLTLASPQVLPALGLDGELAVGWHAARIACGVAGKKRDYLRDEVVST
ncbi:MAG: hypothetical protein IPH80_29845 [Myxococcales bacterium]|nr:hypothetical protein [Myxococcales bacterium]